MSYGQGIGTFLSLVKLGTDDHKKNKLEKEAKAHDKLRPKIAKDANAQYNLNLVESELAGGGMSARAEKAYNDSSDREFSSSLGSLLRGGGDINSVSSLYGAGQEGSQKLAMLQDANRLNKVKNVIDQSNYVDQRNYVTPFQFNTWGPWADKAQALGDARKQIAQNIEGDWASFSSSASGMGVDSGLGGGGNKGSSAGSSSAPYETYLGGNQGRSTVRSGDMMGGYDYNNLDSGIGNIA